MVLLSEDRRKNAAEASTSQEALPVAVDVDPTLKLTPWIAVLAYAIVGVSALVMNVVGTKSFSGTDALGLLVLLLLTGLSFRLAKLVPSVPSSVWVLAITTILTAPFVPTAALLTGITEHLDVILIGLPALTLIGLTVGRDVKALKSLSWKIVVVALLTLQCLVHCGGRPGSDCPRLDGSHDATHPKTLSIHKRPML
jgi:hypothetical protein